MDRLLNLLGRNGIKSTLRNGRSIDDIAKFTANGKPAIAHVNLPEGGGHYVVIDGVTARLGQPVVAIRDPLGGRQYFELADDFAKRFSGWTIDLQ